MSVLLLFHPGAGGVGSGCSAITSTGLSGVPVVVGREYAITADFKAATTARTCALGVRWYDSGGALLSSTLVTSGPDSTSAWTPLQGVATAPASAAFAAVYVEVVGAAAAESHYVDRIGIMEPELWVLPS